MTTVTAKYTSPATARWFDPKFIDSFTSSASSILATSDKQTFKVSAASSNGLAQAYTISAAPTGETDKPLSYSGSLTSTYSGKEYDLSSVYHTDKSSGDEITIQANTLAPGLLLSASAFSSKQELGYDAHVGSVTATYRTNQFAIRDQIYSDSKKHTLKMSASFGRFLNATTNEAVSIGGTVQASYANSNMSLDSKDAGVIYETSNLTATLKTAANMSSVATTIAQRISPNTTIAAQLDAPLASLNSLPGYPRALSLGVFSRFAGFNLQANANLANGIVSATYSRALNSFRVPGNLEVSLQSSLNKGSINSASAIDKVGVQLNFGDY